MKHEVIALSCHCTAHDAWCLFCWIDASEQRIGQMTIHRSKISKNFKKQIQRYHCKGENYAKRFATDFSCDHWCIVNYLSINPLSDSINAWNPLHLFPPATLLLNAKKLYIAAFTKRTMRSAPIPPSARAYALFLKNSSLIASAQLFFTCSPLCVQEAGNGWLP